MTLWARWVGVVLAAGLCSACVTTGPMLHEMESIAPGHSTAELSWEIVNRNRLLAGETEEARYEADLAAYIEEYEHWFEAEPRSGIRPNIRNTDLVHCPVVDDKPTRCLPENYRVNYDPGTNSYRCRDAASGLCRSGGGDWLTDRTREVVLRFGGTERRCLWTIEGEITEDACERRLTTNLGERYLVSVTRSDDGASGQAVVEPRDILIVALGDSFSAGEGNPHHQWRFWRLFSPRHPAAWLDARCHRSLMSGPALTAATLARTNPHVSVTLLHYGCSGASIADGLVTPWAQLETAADIEAQYEQFNIKDEAFNARRVVTTRPANQTDQAWQDVPPAQIEQAQADLTVDGRLVQPDLVLISIGGNDIGFAGIVNALAGGRWGTPEDLRAWRSADSGPIEDWRPYASLDQASWAETARRVSCAGLEPLPCLTARVEDRIRAQGGEPARHNRLDGQYDALARSLRPLVAAPDQVMLTHYPNFVMREPNGVAAGQAAPEQAVGCQDAPFDGRPGLIPGVLAWLPDIGIDASASGSADERFLNPLNGAIDRAAHRHGWRTVSTHVRNGRTHGYCSHQRFYNTLVDSYWDQGRRYDQGRPVGNLSILQDDNPFDLPVGTRLVWNAQRACFVTYPEAGPCVASRAGLPVRELRRDSDRGESLERMVSRPGSLGTTGPVHPNLFGHCNYASAILTQIARVRSDLPLGSTLTARVQAAPEEGLQARTVCDPGLWGYRHVTHGLPTP
ncbi:SGNH/GDSL hydrolase family protein [Brevundimonas bacteroides]|uniref:hypothetical protein n=1 Tax=Brevundimonas bacteroides TaxID=74311 RepID=UPI000494F290|nr:hypothetical protein [Brevundimonas bacteroides]